MRPQIITAVGEFHDGTCFDVKQGLRQGCALSLVFNTFIAEVLLLVFQRFSKSAVILSELMHLHEDPSEMINKSLIDRARWAVCVILTLTIPI